MKNILILLSLFIGIHSSFALPNWGKTGHRVVGAIAEKHLSRKALKKINTLLNGTSLAYVSIHADEIKSDPKYNNFSPWHYVNFKEGEKYGETPAHPKGDIIQGIKSCILKIRDTNSSTADKQFYLKFLVHLLGDLHQPLHVGNAEDKGGNTIKVDWFNTASNLHRVWDSNMIDSYKMSYSELSNNTKHKTTTEIANIKSGSLLDWTYESKALATKVYASAKMNDNLSYTYMYHHFPIAESQLQKAGIRLAHVLQLVFCGKNTELDTFFNGI
ncbi:S1/P1 nuclease [Aquimarina agarilytica]|uniref:S1/P1 nuclease n=1 Tax=Aquimarina agarilytica TaxID=1087449 RepID=UPI00058FA10C|nr:S1/P1 nuclease [Aquimarina agarilytica]